MKEKIIDMLLTFIEAKGLSNELMKFSTAYVEAGWDSEF